MGRESKGKRRFPKTLTGTRWNSLVYLSWFDKKGSNHVAEQLAEMIKAFNDSQSNDVNLLATWERVGNHTDGDWKFRYFELGFGTFEPLERMC